MGTGENDSASVPLMTDKGAESWKPLGKHMPTEANHETLPVLLEYSFFPPVTAPLANPISLFSSIAAPHATGNQNATSSHPHIFVRQINSVEDCVETISHGTEGKSNESREILNKRSEGSNKTIQASEFQNTLASGHNQASEKLEENNQPKVHSSSFEKEQEFGAGQKPLLNCVVAEGKNTEKIYGKQEPSHGHTLMSVSNLSVINSNASPVVPESMVVRNTVTSVSPVLEGERIPDVSVQDEKELEKIRKRRANTLAARRRRIRQKQECEKLQAVADELSSETSELKESLNNYSKECIRIRRENKALLAEIREMCDPDEFATFEAQNPDMEDDIPSESSSSDQSVDTGSDIEEAGSY
ncbi:BZIP domain-containing protein [Heracleum sosnowskyi]|uniref:BZIP domain-containing protein n=1 Tax=Heracleum sosnowskyi TaxID=360622 RepID=A0AAD8H1I8_9APIA|nr:BZIP domain-containing protein [Heracleum sosnowskyi]